LTVMAIGTGVFTALTAAGGQPWLSLLIGVVPGFILLRLAAGVFSSPLYPACARMNANWFTAENRSRVQGIVSSGAGLGGALSPVIFFPDDDPLWLANIIYRGRDFYGSARYRLAFISA